MACLLVARDKSKYELPLRNCCIIRLKKKWLFWRIASWQPNLLTKYLFEQRLYETIEESLEYLLRLTGSLNEVNDSGLYFYSLQQSLDESHDDERLQ